MTTVAFQGELGAYSEEAARQHFGDAITPLPYRTLEHVFDAVDRGQADFGAVPVENSTAGSINKAFDLLLENDLRVHGEILLRVQHNLLALPGTGDALTHVRSHHQALAQCEGFLNERGLVAVPWYDTAGSAKDLATNPEPNTGAIASRLAAKHYDLEIVAESVQDLSQNFTRFFVVGKGNAPHAQTAKTSLVFAVPEVPGALFHALSEFAERDINLTKIESRPRRNRLWHYVFYVDFEAHYLDDAARDALVGLLSKAVFVKLLGSYPAAERVDAGVNGQVELLQI